MADDLDGFFAKKDKKNKKKKKGTKLTSATLIEQFSNEQSTEEQPQINNIIKEKENSIARPDDNEWVEINNDNLAEGLSDLKIKSMDAKEEEEERVQLEQEKLAQEEGSEDENGETTGPWAPLSNSPTTREFARAKPQVPQIPSSIVSSGGKYIPPSQRQNAGALPSYNRGKPREQINVNSVEQFPDLNAGTRQKEKHDPSFDTAKGGGRKLQQAARQESMQLNNKFSVLES